MYKWNDVVKKEFTGQLSPAGDKAIRVTLACGTSATEWTEESAKVYAEIEWSEHESNQFVVRQGAPRHIELTLLTRDEVLERVPNAQV